MADVTFGVKVPEEMKNELSELMKTTTLSGKEFMGVLLSSYKLEKSKEMGSVLGEDIHELQRLLQRIQNIYLNVNERAQFVVEEKVSLQHQVIDEKEGVIREAQEALKKVEEEKKEVEEEKNLLKAQMEEVQAGVEEVKKVLEEQKAQIKQSHLLSEKYEEQIVGLKEEIASCGRLRLEIEERNEENQKLKNRTDELASEVWFLQREVEKNNKEKELIVEKLELERKQLESNYQLELKNQLLEQKLSFTTKIDLLKEDNYKIQQDCHLQMQELLIKMQS